MAIVSRTPTVAENASATSVTGTLPPDRHGGDVVVATFHMDTSAANFTAPSGWTQLCAPVASTAVKIIAAYYRFDPPSGPVGTTAGAAGRQTCICQAYGGVDTTTPVDVATVTATTATAPVTIGSVTTVTSGARLISAVTGDFTNGTWTPPAGMALVKTHTPGTGRAGAYADLTVTAGATGTRAWTATVTTVALIGFLAALRPAPGIGGYTLSVDWSGNGDFTGTREDVTASVLDDPPVTARWGRDLGRAYGPCPAGTLAFSLRNDDRAFMPNYASSPIAGLVEQGRAVNLDVDGTTLFNGVLDDFDIDRSAPAKDFQATCLDGWGRPGAEKLSTELFTGLRTGDAVNIVLDEIGWTGGRSVDRGATTLPWWWAEGDDAATAVEKIVDSEGPPAIAYVEAGTFYFRDRHHRITRTRSTVSQSTWTHAIPSGSAPGTLKVAPDYDYDFGLKNIYNTVDLTVDERVPTARGEVWTADDVWNLADGSTLTLDVDASDPFLRAVTPEQDVDYEVVVGNVTVWLSRDSGQTVKIYVRPFAGTSALLRGMKLRADSVPVLRTYRVRAVESASVKLHGTQTWDRTLPYAGRYDAQNIAGIVTGAYSQARPALGLTIANVAAAYDAEIAARAISDRVTAVLDDTGLDADIFVERVQHEITKLGVIHRLTISGEPVVEQPANVFILDSATNSVLDTNVLGYEGISSAGTVFILDSATQGVLDTNVTAW